MFNRKIDPIELAATEAIISASSALKDHKPDSEEYATIVDQITKLKALMPEKQTRKPLSYDAIFTVIGSLTGIGMIIRHEELNVITSKALSFVKKV